MRYYKNSKHLILLIMLSVVALLVQAAGNHAHVKNAEMVLRDETWTLDADLDVQLGHALEEALSKGIALTFLYEFQLTKPLKYWFDDEVVTERRSISLNYHALTKQYLLQFDKTQKAFDTLGDARRELGAIRDWRLAPHAVLEKNQSYQAALKMHLDRSKLPKALQVDALGESEWELVSPTFSWWVKESVR
ncbi:DUF4390 domain-containing protein [Methylophilus aquaticus]|uniref:DUF4390 domain-containing protein n=1 Tax=Methylophilus aquaticus TaxID=1971610 RepID=A0ABT9JR67_9PROT|nr:DUF4390 domain-containing protein [Methylophilus aquaticus]MDP8567048.1 DUF4390 domain-containing protein [Methylophilus aquaticus]